MKWKLAGLALAAFVATAHAQENVSEPDGYRTENYRAPVPAMLSGVRVLTTVEAETVWRAGSAVFIDVLPRAPKPPNLPAGTIWRDKPRLSIPGTVWLPDTGYGKLADVTEEYFRQGLTRATGGNNAALLVIYCQADCWMSWNAAKRVRSYGYPNVAWYPDGTDGWERAGLPTADSQPEPRTSGIDHATATLYKSNLLPLGLEWRVTRTAAAPREARAVDANISMRDGVLMKKTIFKKGDDLRQDQLVTTFVSIIASLLASAGLDLSLCVYRVLATGQNEGLIEVVPEAHNVSSVLEKFGSISMFLMHNNRHQASHTDALDSYIRSCAGYSISCWITGPRANSRRSIEVGTSQTNVMTRRRSSKIRASQTS